MKPGDEPPLLTFQWRERERPVTRLVFYFLLTVTGAVLFFMLFKVVYPQARHFSTAPQQVFVLDPTQAATRDIVNRTRDENFLLLSPDSDPARAEGTSEELFPVFKPSFAGFQMKLMDLPGVQDTKSLPRIFGIEEMPLPPVATVMKAKAPATVTPGPGEAVVRPVLRGELVGRELVSGGDISAVTLPGGELPRFKVGVSNLGRVTFALPLDIQADAKQMRALQASVSALRFKPVKSPAVQWGEVSLEWGRKVP